MCTNADAHVSNPPDEVQLAADIATLQSIEKPYYSDLGDTDKVTFLAANPEQTIEKLSTRDILTAAGSSHRQGSDIVYTGTGQQGGQQIDAHLKGGDASGADVQGTAAFSGASGQVTPSSRSKGDGGQDWSVGGSDVPNQQGGRWNAADAKVMVDKLAGGGSTASFGAREKSEAYTSYPQFPS